MSRRLYLIKKMGEEIVMVDTFYCDSCGITGVDDIKLKKCDDCDLVKYCSVNCQRHHKTDHEEACKKRAAELRDELLFKQPESSFMGCPSCCLPLSLDKNKSIDDLAPPLQGTTLMLLQHSPLPFLSCLRCVHCLSIKT